MKLLDQIHYYTTPTQRFDAATLKIIACITMFVDHLTLIFLDGTVPGTRHAAMYSVTNGVMLDAVGHAIGRTAMPIFAFLIAEGLYYTRSRGRYLLRMILFAAASQPGFQLMDGYSPDELGLNVMFTFCYAIVAVWITDVILLQYLGREDGDRSGLCWRLPVAVAVCAGICYLAEVVTPTDYGACGVLVVVLFYALRRQRVIGIALNYAIMTAYYPSEIYSLIGMVLVWLYNGKRGRQSKCFFYLFYPCHLLFLCALHRLLMGY